MSAEPDDDQAAPWWSEHPNAVQRVQDAIDDPSAGTSGPLCNAEESGYLSSTDLFCPFSGDGVCRSGCGPTNRERICVNGEE
jgi:hypothetical protein